MWALTIFLPDFIMSLFHFCPPVRTKHFLMSHTLRKFFFAQHSQKSQGNKPVWADNRMTCAFFSYWYCFCVALWRHLIWMVTNNAVETAGMPRTLWTVNHQHNTNSERLPKSRKAGWSQLTDPISEFLMADSFLLMNIVQCCGANRLEALCK